MTPNSIIRVLRPLAANASANPLDVLKIKSALGVLGLYEAPEWGLSQFPEPALFKAIQDFQCKRGLHVDGAMKPGGETEDALCAAMSPNQMDTALYATARTLQSMGRNGDTILAHITPDEAQLLHAITGGGSINPRTGLVEFWHDYEADAYGAGTREQNRGPDRGDKGSNNSNRNRNNNNATIARANPDGQSTSGGGNLTAQNDSVINAHDLSGPATTSERRNRMVLAPDNDLSFTSGFLRRNTTSDAFAPNPGLGEAYWGDGSEDLKEDDPDQKSFLDNPWIRGILYGLAGTEKVKPRSKFYYNAPRG